MSSSHKPKATIDDLLEMQQETLFELQRISDALEKLNSHDQPGDSGCALPFGMVGIVSLFFGFFLALRGNENAPLSPILIWIGMSTWFIALFTFIITIILLRTPAKKSVLSRFKERTEPNPNDASASGSTGNSESTISQ